MMEVQMKTFLISAAFLSAASLSAPALAESVPAAPSVTVQYGDLDLNTSAGRATLRSRMNAAVRKVCHIRFDGGVPELFGRPNCLRETKADVREKANRIIARAIRNAEGLLAAR
jgi:UrcA family protein